MVWCHSFCFFFFFFNDTATTEIYTLSLHDALPISYEFTIEMYPTSLVFARGHRIRLDIRSEEHTSELQSHSDLVCRLLLEKKNINLVYSTKISNAAERFSPYTTIAI